MLLMVFIFPSFFSQLEDCTSTRALDIKVSFFIHTSVGYISENSLRYSGQLMWRNLKATGSKIECIPLAANLKFSIPTWMCVQCCSVLNKRKRVCFEFSDSFFPFSRGDHDAKGSSYNRRLKHHFLLTGNRYHY